MGTPLLIDECRAFSSGSIPRLAVRSLCRHALVMRAVDAIGWRYNRSGVVRACRALHWGSAHAHVHVHVHVSATVLVLLCRGG